MFWYLQVTFSVVRSNRDAWCTISQPPESRRGFSAVAEFVGAVGVGEAQTHVTSSAVFSPLTLELYTLHLRHSLIICKVRRLFCRMFVDAWIDQLALLSWSRCHTLHHTHARSSPRVTLTVCLKSGVGDQFFCSSSHLYLLFLPNPSSHYFRAGFAH